MATTTVHKVKAVDASYYTVKDLAREVEFYTGVLGSAPGIVTDFFAEWNFPGGGSFGVYKSDSGQSAGSGVMFAVDDVKAAVEDLKARGVKFADTIEDIPSCHMAFGVDPEGLGFILHCRKDGTSG